MTHHKKKKTAQTVSKGQAFLHEVQSDLLSRNQKADWASISLLAVLAQSAFCFRDSRSLCTWWRKACPFETGCAVFFFLWCVKRYFYIRLFRCWFTFWEYNIDEYLLMIKIQWEIWQLLCLYKILLSKIGMATDEKWKFHSGWHK